MVETLILHQGAIAGLKATSKNNHVFDSKMKRSSFVLDFVPKFDFCPKIYIYAPSRMVKLFEALAWRYNKTKNHQIFADKLI